MNEFMKIEILKQWAQEGVSNRIFDLQERRYRIEKEYGEKRRSRLDDLLKEIDMLKEEKEVIKRMNIREIF